jgi:hypothetical protein
MTTDYTKKLMTLLEAGPKSNQELCGSILSAAGPYATLDPRDVDRALQKLRKAGRIRPGRRNGKAVWFTEHLATCPTCKGTGLVKA